MKIKVMDLSPVSELLPNMEISYFLEFWQTFLRKKLIKKFLIVTNNHLVKLKHSAIITKKFQIFFFRNLRIPRVFKSATEFPIGLCIYAFMSNGEKEFNCWSGGFMTWNRSDLSFDQ